MKPIIFALTFFCFSGLSAQDLAFGRKMVDTLTSPYFWGRGYTNDGMSKAADFLQSQFRSYGLEPMNGRSYFQEFSYPINTFPGKMQAMINGKELVPGIDFIVGPESKTIKAEGSGFRRGKDKDSLLFYNSDENFVIELADKLTMDLSSEIAEYGKITVDRKSINGLPVNFKVNIENKFLKNFKTNNICAFIKGTAKSDSFIFITAHYDHLGGLGKDTYFPGANDNASGVSLLMNLAHYYAVNPQRYSIAFILFAGEEPGLLGSKYFTENPLVPLKRIRFLINTDLAGTGEEGITVVNATEFPKEFAMMNAVNDEGKFLVKINSRGKAANSDHYFFTEMGVPSFFFYTLGGIKAYHDVFDKAGTLPLNEHEDLFKLIIKFDQKLMGN
ncbi:MAG: M28 family peptidase [Ferruginibacter sp.]